MNNLDRFEYVRAAYQLVALKGHFIDVTLTLTECYIDGTLIKALYNQAAKLQPDDNCVTLPGLGPPGCQERRELLHVSRLSFTKITTAPMACQHILLCN